MASIHSIPDAARVINLAAQTGIDFSDFLYFEIQYRRIDGGKGEMLTWQTERRLELAAYVSWPPGKYEIRCRKVGVDGAHGWGEKWTAHLQATGALGGRAPSPRVKVRVLTSAGFVLDLSGPREVQRFRVAQRPDDDEFAQTHLGWHEFHTAAGYIPIYTPWPGKNFAAEPILDLQIIALPADFFHQGESVPAFLRVEVPVEERGHWSVMPPSDLDLHP